MLLNGSANKSMFYASQNGIDSVRPTIQNLSIILERSNNRALSPQWITFPDDKVTNALLCCRTSKNKINIG